MKKKDLINLLQTLPEAIKSNEEKFNEKIDQIEELKLKNKTIKSLIEINIMGVITSDGKKEFSNDIQRAAELKRRLKNNQEYQEHAKSMDKLGKEIKEFEITLGYLKRRFRGMESISRIGL